MNNKLYAFLFVGVFICVLSPQQTFAQWQKQNLPPLKDMFYFPLPLGKNVMWATSYPYPGDTSMGSPIEYVRTTDGGQTYKTGILLNGHNEDYFFHVEPFDAKTAYLTGGTQDITTFYFRRTIDTGATWQDMPYKPTTFPDHYYLFNANEGILICDPDSIGANIVSTTDGGNTFRRLPQTNVPRMDASSEFFIDYGLHKIIGNAIMTISINFQTGLWRVWRSMDRGRNWTAGAEFDSGDPFIPRIEFTDVNNGMILPGFSSITRRSLSTTDGGATWHEGYDSPGLNTFSLNSIPNTQTMFSVFMDTTSKMLFSALTNDLGKTWTTRKDIVKYALDSVFYPQLPPFAMVWGEIVDNNTGWYKFGRDGVYRYANTTPLVPEKPDLDLELTADNNDLPLWGSVKFTLTIKNRGISKATGIKVNWLPPYKRTNTGAGPFAYQAAYSSKGQYDSWNGIWSINELQPGETQTATFHLFVLQNTTKVTQTAQIIAETEQDLDSQPNNMTTTPREDDEATFTSVANRTNFVEPESSNTSAISFKAFPNPTHDNVTVHYKLDGADYVTFTLSDVTGRILYEKMTPSVKMGSERVSLQDVPKGVYILKMMTKNESKTEKIVRE